MSSQKISFKKWFNEMAGTGAIVSCKDRNNPDFQIWGSLSNLGCKPRKSKVKTMKFNSPLR